MSHSTLENKHTFRAIVVGLLTVCSVILLGWALRETYLVTMPLACAFFVTALVYPIKKWFDSRMTDRFRWVGIAACMALYLLVVAAFGGSIYLMVEMTAPKMPEYVSAVQDSWQNVVAWAERNNLPVPENPQESDGVRGQVMTFVQSGISSVWTLGVVLVLIFFYTLLMLLEAHRWKKKIGNSLTSDKTRKIVETVGSIVIKMREYLWVRTIVSAISGLAAGLWTWVMGVDFPLLWGFMTFILNYVPNIGSVISVIPPTLLAVIDSGLGQSMLVLAGLVAIEQVIGNYIDPRLQGKRLEISPLMVLFNVIFWSWVWGAAGALIAVPIVVMFIIIFAHIEPLRPVALLLSNTHDMELLDERMNGEDGSGAGSQTELKLRPN